MFMSSHSQLGVNGCNVYIKGGWGTLSTEAGPKTSGFKPRPAFGLNKHASSYTVHNIELPVSDMVLAK